MTYFNQISEKLVKREKPSTMPTLSAGLMCLIGLMVQLCIAHADTLTVTNRFDKGNGSLRSLIAGAKNGDIIVFDHSLAGSTINLTEGALTLKKDLDIEGPGTALLAISGGGTSRVLDIAEGAKVRIAGLTIKDGSASSGNGAGGDHGGAGGGGILNAGTLTIANAILFRNVAMGHGGAIANGPFGVLMVANSSFIGNQAVSRDPLAIAEGGAIYNSNRGSIATVVGCSFTNNQGIGANGGILGSGLYLLGQCNGGAIHNGLTSILVVENSVFVENQAIGGSGGGTGVAAFGLLGSAIGGAISNDENADAGVLSVKNCLFAHNQAIGGSNNVGTALGSGFTGNAGGGAIYQGGTGTILDSTFIGNQAIGGNANSGSSGVQGVGTALGGAIQNPYFGICPVNTTISGCAFSNNVAIGGLQNSGGVFAGGAMGGALLNFQGANAIVQTSVLIGNKAIADQTTGAKAWGGAVANLISSTLALRACTITGNSAVGSEGSGGGAYLGSDSVACIDAATTIVGNSASTASNDIFGAFTTCR